LDCENFVPSFGALRPLEEFPWKMGLVAFFSSDMSVPSVDYVKGSKALAASEVIVSLSLSTFREQKG
jgi:hypothetical protein